MHSLVTLLLVLVSISFVYSDRCGGNCPTNTCLTCPCGREPKYVDVNDWCSKFDKWDQACCRCIVQRESHGNANAVFYNGPSRKYDVGLWQINQYYNWDACNNGEAPCDLNANLECAKKVWRNGGRSFRQWATARGCRC